MGKYTARDKIRQAEYYRETIAKGLCYKCKTPTTIGKRCIDCKKRDKTHNDVTKQYRIANNLCLICGHVLITNKRHCEDCALKLATRYLKLKTEVFNHYGRICAFCGEDNLVCLELDHINGGGTKHREEISATFAGRHFYYKLRKNNYPEGLRVLCANCHLKRHAFRMVMVAK